MLDRSGRSRHSCLMPNLKGKAFGLPGEGNGNTLQYSCLENSMDRGAWQAAVHGNEKSPTWLSDFHFHFTYSVFYWCAVNRKYFYGCPLSVQEVSITNVCWSLSSDSLASIERIMSFFFFRVLILWILSRHYWLLNQLCDFRINPTCLQHYFTYCWVWFANILLRNFAFMKNIRLYFSHNYFQPHKMNWKVFPSLLILGRDYIKWALYLL